MKEGCPFVTVFSHEASHALFLNEMSFVRNVDGVVGMRKVSGSSRGSSASNVFFSLIMSEDISNPPKAEQECITSSPPPCYDWAEVEFIDAVEEGSMGGSSPIAEASVISSPLVGVGGEAEDVSMPAGNT